MTIEDSKVVSYVDPSDPDTVGSGPYGAFKKVWQPKGFQLTEKFAAQETASEETPPVPTQLPANPPAETTPAEPAPRH